MRYYLLTAVVNGHDAKLKRRMFATRSEAIDYMFDYYDKNNLYSLQVRDEYCIDGNKHNIEYVCNYHNRFTVTRY